jgi:hypothetical protein
MLYLYVFTYYIHKQINTWRESGRYPVIIYSYSIYILYILLAMCLGSSLCVNKQNTEDYFYRMHPVVCLYCKDLRSVRYNKTNVDTIVSILFYFVVVTDFNPYRKYRRVVTVFWDVTP